jgi:ACS family tartrate transporter-like MFS transporter
VDRSHKLTWGMIPGATATGPCIFTVKRFLLGLAGAGFYPGLVLFFTYWFPDRHRARVAGGLALALPLASGTPLRPCVAGGAGEGMCSDHTSL